ncbi:MAG: SGNH/GDSL hydrolase family protein [Phototrophicaceae bacterium]
MNKYRLMILIVCFLLSSDRILGQDLSQDALPIATNETTSPTATPQPITLTDDISAHIREIYIRGQRFGNRVDAFSKVGDSLTVSQNFMYPLGVGRYDLGIYDYLQAVIDLYSARNARIGNSFINESLAAREGWSTRQVLNPTMSNPTFCNPQEIPLLCEYRLVRPSVALILFGTNDVGYRQVDDFVADMETIITYSEELGIIPILSTIPYRPDAVMQVERFNRALLQLADDKALPIIDLYDYTVGLPNYGLTSDDIHLSSSPAGITGAATFTSQNLQYGYVVRNLATLDMLHHIYTIIND